MIRRQAGLVGPMGQVGLVRQGGTRNCRTDSGMGSDQADHPLHLPQLF